MHFVSTNVVGEQKDELRGSLANRKVYIWICFTWNHLETAVLCHCCLTIILNIHVFKIKDLEFLHGVLSVEET